MAHTKLPSVIDDEKLLPFLKPTVSQQGELSFSVDLLQYITALGILSKGCVISSPYCSLGCFYVSKILLLLYYK